MAAGQRAQSPPQADHQLRPRPKGPHVQAVRQRIEQNCSYGFVKGLELLLFVIIVGVRARVKARLAHLLTLSCVTTCPPSLPRSIRSGAHPPTSSRFLLLA